MTTASNVHRVLGVLLGPWLLAAGASAQGGQAAPLGSKPQVVPEPVYPRPEAPPFAVLRRALPLQTARTKQAVAGDLDGDGDTDLVAIVRRTVGAGSFDGLAILRNDGPAVFRDVSGAFAGPAPFPVGGGALILLDIDADDDLDIFVGAAVSAAPNRLFLNEGAAGFEEQSWRVPGESNTVAAVALGDVDGDGDLDAVLATLGYVGYSGGGGQVPNRLWRNEGAGVFADASEALPSVGYARDVALADVDGDGDLDVLFANGDDCVDVCFGVWDELLLNDGSGAFVPALGRLPANAGDSFSAAFGDVDGDGDPDIVIGDSYGNRLYLNDGSGYFGDSSPQLPPGGQFVALDLRDMDGDGDVDALIDGPPTYLPARLLKNDGSGWFSPPSLAIPFGEDPVVVEPLDADGDGDLDLFAGTGGQDELLLNDGAAVFQNISGPFAGDEHLTRSVAVGDVDGDGDADLVFGESGGDPDGLYVNDGVGNFAKTSGQLPPGYHDTACLALGDVDGDGDLDLLIGNYGTSSVGTPNRLYLNDGEGFFLDASARLPNDRSFSFAVALGDVDGDGDLDAMIGNRKATSSVTGQNRLYRNDGTGTFSDDTAALPVDTDDTQTLVLVDVDGDGDLDALLGNSNAPNRLYVNDGTGTFTDAPGRFPDLQEVTRAIAVGDVDGDGDPDALITNSGRNRLLVNEEGHFSLSTKPFPRESASSHDGVLADVDADGDLDAILVSRPSPNRLLINDGSGGFRRPTTDLPNALSRSVAVVDVDLDGDADIVLGNNGENVVLTNMTRQLARRGVPGIGKPLVLDLYGSPDEPWSLELLAPGGPTPIATGLLDTLGRATYETAIPYTAALVGQTFIWRAFLGTGVRTGRDPLHETATITDL